MKFIQCDYNAIELCTVAQTDIDLGLGSSLADYLNSGSTPRDAHLLLGSKWHEFRTGEALTPDEMQRRRQAGDIEIEVSRKQAKAPNLSFRGGAGNARLAEMSDGVVNAEQVKQLRSLLYEVVPETSAYLSSRGWVGQQKHCNDIYRTYGYGFNGRWRHYCTYAACANGRAMQSPAADGAKEAVWKAFKELQKIDGYLVAFIHDELLAEVPDDKVTEGCEILARSMCEGMRVVVPDVRIVVEFSAMNRWTKNAKEHLVNGHAWLEPSGQFQFKILGKQENQICTKK